jgi:Holliday junction DNA helicase RuvA
MIGRLTGQLETLSLDRVVVDVQGVGYEVNVPAGLAGRLDDDGDVTLFVHTNVRDDAIDLYGFKTRGERRLFERLTSVSGIGPKTALRIVSDMRPPEIVQGIRQNSTDAFKEVKGIGEKTAQRLILDLKDSLNDLEFDQLAPPDERSDAESERVQNLRSALQNFGYDGETIDGVVAELDGEIEEADGVEPLLSSALEMLR